MATAHARSHTAPWLLLAAGLCLAPLLAAAQDGGGCGSLANAYGPYDYRTDRGPTLSHFTAPVENLIRGHTSGKLPGGDLDYTLRAFPNHHRALLSVMRYGEKTKSPHPRDLRYSVECYFDRALRFRPDDTTVRMLFATFLSRNNRTPEALQQLQAANELAKDNGFTHYNIGLVYLEMKVYDRALAQAHRAIALGFAQTALKDGLVAAGQWKDPPAPASQAPASAAQ
jgi:tetratricopeptide (TPR) repeat protein